MDNLKDISRAALGKKVTRSGFLRMALSAIALLPFLGSAAGTAANEVKSGFNGRKKGGIKGDHDLVIAKGDDPYHITVKAVESMGGMERFVKKGSTVIVKPNIGWDRTPEQAGNTNPMVVGALVDMAYRAGAKKVKVFDVTCNDARRCYANSGIEAAAKERGAEVYVPDGWDTVGARFGYDSPMKGWPILREAIECDTFINVPVVKHHALTGLTLSIKNLMGVCGGTRGIIHQNIGRKLADLTDFINPDLTVIDAYRVLLRNGPTGGNLKDVDSPKTVVVATDPVLADSYACSIMSKDPMSVLYIKASVERGLGSADIAAASKVFLNV